MAKQVTNYLKLDAELIQPTNCIERPEMARRPANATLQIDKAKEVLGFKPTNLALIEIFN